MDTFWIYLLNQIIIFSYLHIQASTSKLGMPALECSCTDAQLFRTNDFCICKIDQRIDTHRVRIVRSTTSMHESIDYDAIQQYER